MHKKLICGLVIVGLLTVFVSACGIRDASTSSLPTVHMGGATFLQTSITIHKGDMLNLVDDVASTHIIANGTWENGVAKPHVEGGAPTINQTYAGNDSSAVGPFSTAGTFQLYCTIQTNMNLTVNVQ